MAGGRLSDALLASALHSSRRSQFADLRRREHCRACDRPSRRSRARAAGGTGASSRGAQVRVAMRDEVSQVTTLKLADGAGMDQQIKRHPWHWAKWPIGARVGVGAGLALGLVLLAVAILFGNAERSVRMARNTLTIAPVTEGIYHDFIPLRGKVVPHDTIYIDAASGGRVARVLVEAGDKVSAGQALVEFDNTTLQLQVIQQESQLNQAITQLQTNEITLEVN